MLTVVARPGVASFFVAVALASVLTASRTPIAADAKLLGTANVGTLPWAGNHFDILSAAPDEPSWNIWFDGSLAAGIVKSVLGAACLALGVHLWCVTADASNAPSLLERAPPETPR